MATDKLGADRLTADLRELARSYPDEVRAFVEEQRDRLSALSIREATKHF